MNSTPSSTTESATTPRLAMRLRADFKPTQARKASTWLYVAHHFRNAAVSFITERRQARAKWIALHRALAREWIPEEFAGNDTTACSKWLTAQLEHARLAAIREFALPSGKSTATRALLDAWSHLSRGERTEARERLEVHGAHVRWLLLPRTVLDQVIQDLNKTCAKAIKDLTENRARHAQGLKPKKTAGFPTHHRWQYANSIRLQVVAAKNTDFREGWARGELVLPGLGRLKINESGYAWPNTPPSLITVSRGADNAWHVSFACAPGEGAGARARRLTAAGKVWSPLPLAANGLPAIEGLDMSLPDKAVSNVHGSLGRKRYLKTCASKLRFRNKDLARKTKGSHRHTKSVRKLGNLHVRVANERAHENRSAAQQVAERSAIVCVETLKLSFMQRNRRLSQSVHDLGWAQFLAELDRAMTARGHLLLYAGQFSPTTQTCPSCGAINRALKNALSIRQWDCPGCGTHHDRDIAAAHNIQDDALRLFLESSTGAESVPGMPNLHPELAAFIARRTLSSSCRNNVATCGGLTALVPSKGGAGRRFTPQGEGLKKPGKRESLPHTPTTRLERAVGV